MSFSSAPGGPVHNCLPPTTTLSRFTHSLPIYRFHLSAENRLISKPINVLNLSRLLSPFLLFLIFLGWLRFTTYAFHNLAPFRFHPFDHRRRRRRHRLLWFPLSVTLHKSEGNQVKRTIKKKKPNCCSSICTLFQIAKFSHMHHFPIFSPVFRLCRRRKLPVSPNDFKTFTFS